MSPDLPTRGQSRHDALMNQGVAIWDGDPATVAAFVQLALADPVTAAGQLAWYFDCSVTHHEGSDDCRALENWAATLATDDLSYIAWRTAHSRGPASMRAAMSAIVAGGLALADDMRDAA